MFYYEVHSFHLNSLKLFVLEIRWTFERKVPECVESLNKMTKPMENRIASESIEKVSDTRG